MCMRAWRCVAAAAARAAQQLRAFQRPLASCPRRTTLQRRPPPAPAPAPCAAPSAAGERVAPSDAGTPEAVVRGAAKATRDPRLSAEVVDNWLQDRSVTAWRTTHTDAPARLAPRGAPAPARARSACRAFHRRRPRTRWPRPCRRGSAAGRASARHGARLQVHACETATTLPAALGGVHAARRSELYRLQPARPIHRPVRSSVQPVRCAARRRCR